MIPNSTYRLQFNPAFRFRDAQALVPYLKQLGITDIYSSPLAKPRRGSMHGYDVTDPLRLNPELGSEAAFDRFTRELRRNGLGLLLDIVPNHMAAGSENAWWMDILEKGPHSQYASYFDVDWNSSYQPLQGKILVPVLGTIFGRALEAGELKLKLDESGFSVCYYQTCLPLSPKSYGSILSFRMEALKERLGAGHTALKELRALLRSIERLRDEPGASGDGRRDAAIKEKLRQLCATRAMRGFLDKNIRLINGHEGDPRSFDLLDQLLSDQYFWLSYWKLANDAINYRRFFAISELISVRVEEHPIFDVVHKLPFRLIREGKVTGLRIDHIDGLYDPAKYLRWMRDALDAGFYVVVEKILCGEEELPPQWPVEGTTGYDFMNAVNGLFVNPGGLGILGEVYERLIGRGVDYAQVVYANQKLILETQFAGEMSSLSHHLARLASQDRYSRDLPPDELAAGLREVTACFPVYRTYMDGLGSNEHDQSMVERALAEARQRNPTLTYQVFDFLKRLLTLEYAAYLDPDKNLDRVNFVMRWQQFTGPIMAKGVEDTALYNYNRLLSLNEVGGEAAGAGAAPNVFHRRIHARQRRHPYAMNATMTHDAKRGEDVRARLNVLSELPEAWERHAERWMRWNAARKQTVRNFPAPDSNEELHIYQTMLGAWPASKDEVPAFKDRLRAYMQKALREAKVHSDWIRPNGEYEAAVEGFVEALFSSGRFLDDFLRFQPTIAKFGAYNSLSQALLKIACPGIPDFYQGSELWDLRLVDPDNRAPVDFQRRTELLSELEQRAGRGLAGLPGELLDHWEDGRIKLFLIWKALQHRRAHADLFLNGEYIPLGATGRRKNHICAFARRNGKEWAIVVVPRFLASLVIAGERPFGRKVWGGSALRLPAESPRRWVNILTGKSLDSAASNTLPLEAVFSNFPVAFLSPD